MVVQNGLRLRLTQAERRLWRSFHSGTLVQLGDNPIGVGRTPGQNAPADGATWGPERTVRAQVIVALLLGAREPGVGAVPAVRLRGARITGRLELRGGTVDYELALSGCYLDEAPDFSGSVTRTMRFTDCRLPGFNGGGMRVSGHLSLSGAHVTGTVRLPRASFESGLWMGGTKIDGGVHTGALTVDAGFYLENAEISSGLRLVGARLTGGLFMDGATLRNPGGDAFTGDSMVVEDVMKCGKGFTALGCVRLRGARLTSLSITGALRSPDTPYALHASHMEAREVYLKYTEPVEGVVTLAHSRIGTMRDDPESWPEQLRLNGLIYETLRGGSIERRIGWVARDPYGFLPQPYEQLAAWYLRDGNDLLARRTLLAKQRARRRTFNPLGRLWGRLLDVTVGYGYRPWLAGVWFALLLAVGTVTFGLVPPRAIKPDESPGFDPFAYTFDLLLPFPAFGQRDLFDPAGWTQGLAYGLIIAGWILATALIAGATRVLRPS
ncbi:hypothetical protein [Nonomuraea dietziae]|uniref:hypothetical protein n=1 Tax=Nonomuraea dietziae TaxID=65515 RepID=UPI0033EB2EA8